MLYFMKIHKSVSMLYYVVAVVALYKRHFVMYAFRTTVYNVETMISGDVYR